MQGASRIRHCVQGVRNDIRDDLPDFSNHPQETGTGFGLWLTKNIVEKHGGNIRVSSSNIGKTGTVLKLTIPQGDYSAERDFCRLSALRSANLVQS